MTSEKIRSILNSPADPGLEYIAEPRQYEKEVLDGFYMETVNYGFELDKFCPAKLGQLTVIVGHTNVGKTTVILWLLSKLIKQGKRVLIYSAENRISVLHKQLTKFVTGLDDVTKKHLESIRDYTRYIKHERHFSYRDMLNQAT